MDKMMAEDFVGISMSGQVNTKEQQLDRVKTRKMVVTKVDLTDRKIKLVGTIAIVTCQADVEGTGETGSMKGLYRYTRIYQRLSTGEWKITSFEATRIHQPRSDAEKKTKSRPSSSNNAAVVEPRFG
jgi:ketosteroid isomerase-like protein